jgi:hypothetical protein
MSQSKYVILVNDGSSHDCSRRQLFKEPEFDLADLLADGWRPVHEIPMGRSTFYDDNGEGWEYACVLILLVKD